MPKRSVPDHLSFDALETRQNANGNGFSPQVGLRVHRAISWIGRSERASDPDARFVFLWIGFNSAYANQEDFEKPALLAKQEFRDFFQKIDRLDTNQRVYDAIWEHFPGPVRNLLYNQYVFEPFWKHQNGIKGSDNWESQLQNARSRCFKAMQDQDTVQVLCLLFDRLYVLRNQIIHGGATWNSSVNREQVKNGSDILSFLVPEFIDIIMDNPDEDWGRPMYPVVDH